jgi:hypothetical protein
MSVHLEYKFKFVQKSHRYGNFLSIKSSLNKNLKYSQDTDEQSLQIKYIRFTCKERKMQKY